MAHTDTPMTGFETLSDQALSEMADVIEPHQDANPFFEEDYEACFAEMERRGWFDSRED